MPIAQFTVKKLPYGKHKLNDLYQHFFNSNIHLQHSAIGDVYALSKIYPKIEFHIIGEISKITERILEVLI